MRSEFKASLNYLTPQLQGKIKHSWSLGRNMSVQMKAKVDPSFSFIYSGFEEAG